MNKRAAGDELPTGMMKVSTAIDHEHLDISINSFRKYYAGIPIYQVGHGLPNYVFWSDIEQRTFDIVNGLLER